MPDADRIGKLSHRWSKMYRKVCEGYFDSDSLASDALDLLRKDIQGYGDAPIRFLREVSSRLIRVQKNPLFHSIHNWHDENRFLDDLKSAYMKKYRPKQRGIDIAVEACKDIIHKFRNGENLSEDLEKALYDRYSHQIYESNFSDLARSMLQDQEDIVNRIDEMNTFVYEKINSLSSQIVRKRNTKRLSAKPRLVPRKVISIKDDVFSLGNKR